MGLSLVRVIADLHRAALRLGDNAPGLLVELGLRRMMLACPDPNRSVTFMPTADVTERYPQIRDIGSMALWCAFPAR